MADNDDFDPATAALLNALLEALQNADIEASAQAVIPLVHPTLLDGGALEESIRKYSFKKAHTTAHLYRRPVDVTRVRERGPTTLGEQAGQLVEFFVARVDPSTGEPAPIPIFYPDDGGPPAVAYLGNL